MSDKTKKDQRDRSIPKEDEPDNPMPTYLNKSDNTNQRQRYVDVTAMIRSLQRTEGLTDCFRRGLADCDQRDCAWRQYCLEKQTGLPPSE